MPTKTNGMNASTTKQTISQVGSVANVAKPVTGTVTTAQSQSTGFNALLTRNRPPTSAIRRVI